jgi:hypothetical protein
MKQINIANTFLKYFNILASQISNEIAEKKMKENQKFQENSR